MGAFSAGKIEVYHEFHSFMCRLQQGIYNIRLVVICIMDKETLHLLEAIRGELFHVPVVFCVGGEVEMQSRRLYAFFPRIVLRVGENDVLALEFIKAKMGFACRKPSETNISII